MTSALNDQSLDHIFRSARAPNSWADCPVEDDTVREIYDLMKGGQHLRTAGTRIQSNFICSIGYGDPASVFPRNPRLSFEEAGRWA